MARVKCQRCSFVNPEARDNCSVCGAPLPKINLEIKAPPRAKTPDPAQQILFRKGQILANRYTIIDIIGRGGMGCIYRALDNTLGEEVALKTLLPQFMTDKIVVERFFNEARIARNLSHPNIVRVHDIGQAGQIIYISMEYLKGKSLRALLDELAPGQRLSVKMALDIIDELCAALEYAHLYTIHRDIKPENVMVREDGAVKLMDFGISKLMANSNMTATSVIMGTPYYMPPEQLRDSSRVDARADIYSIGVMLYEILTGSVPTGVPKPASQLMREVPPALDPIVTKCVEPDPANRFQNARELREALRPIRELAAMGSKAGAAAPAPGKGLAALLGRRALGVALITLAFVCMLLGLALAERHRQTMIAEYESGGNVAPPPPTVKTEETFAERFDAVTLMVGKARAKAKLASRGESVDSVVAQAELFWELAKTESQDEAPAAFTHARYALECFLGPVICPDNMVFVPPGEVGIDGQRVFVDGFLIDKTEVTNKQYFQFCVQQNWYRPYEESADPLFPELPVTMVTFYDAQAYAASVKRKLPTEAQWARAAYGEQPAAYPWGDEWEAGRSNCFAEENPGVGAQPPGTFPDDTSWCGCVDVVGNVSEWTRSLAWPLPYGPNDGREDQTRIYFGAIISIRGRNYAESPVPLQARYEMSYEDASANVGFRCVWEFPKTLDGISALEGRV